MCIWPWFQPLLEEQDTDSSKAESVERLGPNLEPSMDRVQPTGPKSTDQFFCVYSLCACLCVLVGNGSKWM